MKAAVFKGISTIEVRDIDTPRCEAEGILVRVMVCGICGSDIRNFHGGLRHGIKKQIMGHEFAGIVEEVGSKVDRFRVGDRVAVAPDVSCGQCYYCRRGLVNLCMEHRLIGTHWPGGFAQYVHLPGVILEHGIVHRIPEGLSFEAASLSEPVSSVLISQARAGISLGSTVLIIGDGPVGCLHTEVARARGAHKIIMAGLTRMHLVVKFEPDLLIDAGKQDTVGEVLKYTDGLGVDIAIIANPVASTQEQGVEAVKKRGTVVLFGGVSNNDRMTTLNSNLIHYNELTIQGAFSYTADIHEQALEVIRDGKIRAEKYFSRRVSLEDLVEGIAEAERGEALKILVDPWL